MAYLALHTHWIIDLIKECIGDLNPLFLDYGLSQDLLLG